MAEDIAEQPETSEETASRHVREDRRTFFPVMVMGIVFVMTMLVYVAAMMGDETRPIDPNPSSVTKQGILQHGLTVMLVETALLIIVSFRAMAQDRRTTLQRLAENREQSQAIASAGPPANS